MACYLTEWGANSAMRALHCPMCTWAYVRTDTCAHAAAHVCKRPGNHMSAKLGSSLARMVKYNTAVVVGSPAAH